MKKYLRHRIENVIDVKELIALEYLDFEGKYKNYIEAHEFWELCYVEKGKIAIRVDGEERVLNENELMLIAPDMLHSYRSAQGNDNRVFVVCFESFSQALKSLSVNSFVLEERELNCIQTVIYENAQTFKMDEKDLLSAISEPNFGGGQAIILQLEYLLISLIRRLSREENSKIVFLSEERFYADLVGVITRFLHEHIHEKLSLQSICDKVNYSRSFVCKTFKEQTGETLITCFNRLKMEEAKRLLVGTNISATEISEQLGFSELKYFGALFKKYAGLSPLEYREKEYGKNN